MADYPYLPSGQTFRFVSWDDIFMIVAKEYARQHSLDDAVKTGAVVVKADVIIGYGANGSEYHKLYTCERVKLGIPTGEGYHLCEGCHPKNHAEPRAISSAQEAGHDTSGASLYLWGHWWACEPCWKAILEAGIVDVVLLENSRELFHKDSPGNILGRWFD
jgi:deoxycytidylate deaminase